MVPKGVIKFMRYLKRLSFLFIFVLCLCASVVDVACIPNHSPEIYVNDFAKVLNEEVKGYILSYSKDLDDKTGAQLVVVTVDSLEAQGYR